MKIDTYFINKLMLYILGLLILAIGSNLFINASLGVAPSCTLALTLSYILPFGSYAFFNFITNGIILLIEAILVKKFGKTQVVQLLLTFVYSLFIQLLSPIVSTIMPTTLPYQIITAVIACFILAIGASLTIASKFTVLPMEGLVGVIAVKKHQEFGQVRIKVEVIMIIAVAIFSLICLHSISSIGIGTVIAAYCTGRITTWFSHNFQKRLDIFVGNLSVCIEE